MSYCVIIMNPSTASTWVGSDISSSTESVVRYMLLDIRCPIRHPNHMMHVLGSLVDPTTPIIPTLESLNCSSMSNNIFLLIMNVS